MMRVFGFTGGWPPKRLTDLEIPDLGGEAGVLEPEGTRAAARGLGLQ